MTPVPAEAEKNIKSAVEDKRNKGIKNKSFTLHDLPPEERPRERLAKYGESTLSVQELLQIILRSGTRGESVALLAQKLLAHFGNLQRLKSASIEELTSLKGIGLAKAVQIKAALELGRRAELTLEKKSGRIQSPADVFKLVKAKLKDYAKEHFYIVALTTRNTVIREISIGTLNSSLVHPREVFAEAIKERANSIILVHNHPSGETEPSEEDLEINKRLIEAGKILGIEVIDHIIVAKNGFFSFKEKGLI